MPGPAFRTDGRVALCPVEPEDHDFLARTMNHASIRRMVNTNEPKTHEDVSEFVESETTVFFLLQAEDSRVGACLLFDRDTVHGRAEVAYWLAPDARGEGYATAAVELLQEYAVEELRLRKLFARVFEGNAASAAVLDRAGFEQEGRLRDHYYIDGEYLDATLFGWFADDA